MEKSPIDELFHELYGFYPKKAGQAYEYLVAASLKLVSQKSVLYNQHIKGKYSETDYQIDGLIDEDNTMVEAKDYTLREKNSKVGRPDLQKMQGALTDLEFEDGLFASATDFSKPAEKYSISSVINPKHKEISLLNVKPSTELDEKGRIKTIIINLHYAIPDFDKGKYDIVFTEYGLKEMEKNDLIGKPITIRLERFYNSDGSQLTTLHDLTLNNQPEGDAFNDEFSEGQWILENAYIKIENNLYSIKGIKYNIPYLKDTEIITIEAKGNAKVLIKCDKLSINKLLTDEELKKITFDKGNIT